MLHFQVEMGCLILKMKLFSFSRVDATLSRIDRSFHVIFGAYKTHTKIMKTIHKNYYNDAITYLTPYLLNALQPQHALNSLV